MNASLVALLLLAACAAAAPNDAVEEKVGQLDPFPWFHPHIPPWIPHRTTTKKPTATTTEAPTTTTEAPTTITEQQTTTKHHKTTTKPHKTTTKPHKTTTTTLKPTTKPHKTTTSTPTTTQLPPVRGDYQLVGNFGYYKLHTKYATWADAWESCIKDDAHLLVVRTQDEFDALYRWIPNEMPPYVHYGVHQRYANQKFVTIFDEPLESVPYHKFGWDYSNATYFNNKDFPVTCIDLSISMGSSGIYLNSDSQSRDLYKFICKKDI